MTDCIFCKIAAGQIPTAKLYDDGEVVIFRDINPEAPVHLLIIPRKHITSLNDPLEDEKALLGHLTTVAARMAKEQGVDGTGYRIVINTNAESGQSVFHLHVHIIPRKAGVVMKPPASEKEKPEVLAEHAKALAAAIAAG